MDSNISLLPVYIPFVVQCPYKHSTAGITSMFTDKDLELAPWKHNSIPSLEHGRPIRPFYTPVLEDIVIPTHLLDASNHHGAWYPDATRTRRTAVQQNHPAQPFDYFGFQSVFERSKAPDELVTLPMRPRRTASISVGALGRSRVIGADSRRGNEVTVAGPRMPLRRTSLPADLERTSVTTLRQAKRAKSTYSEEVDPLDTETPPSPVSIEDPTNKPARVRWDNDNINIDPYDWGASTATTLIDDGSQIKPAFRPALRKDTPT